MKRKFICFFIIIFLFLLPTLSNKSNNKKTINQERDNNIIGQYCENLSDFYNDNSDNSLVEINEVIQIQENPTELLKENEPSYIDGYAISIVNVREQPNTDCNILGQLYFNEIVSYIYYNEDWVQILYKDTIAYVSSDYISNEKCDYQLYDVPLNNFKSYMPYNYFNSNSNQYLLQQSAYIGNYGIRQVDDRYCIAMGNGFNVEVGDYVDLILENGIIIPCIIGDIKDDRHTDDSNMITVANGCISEFIVDINSLNNKVLAYGDMSYICNEWQSSIVAIKVYNKNFLKED